MQIARCSHIHLVKCFRTNTPAICKKSLHGMKTIKGVSFKQRKSKYFCGVKIFNWPFPFYYLNYDTDPKENAESVDLKYNLIFNLPRVLSLPPVSTHSQNLSNSDENIDGIHVDSNTSVDRIKRRCSISDRVSLRLVYDLLCIVEKKSSEQD